jgi:hypothetical protein
MSCIKEFALEISKVFHYENEYYNPSLRELLDAFNEIKEQFPEATIERVKIKIYDEDNIVFGMKNDYGIQIIYI